MRQYGFIKGLVADVQVVQFGVLKCALDPRAGPVPEVVFIFGFLLLTLDAGYFSGSFSHEAAKFGRCSVDALFERFAHVPVKTCRVGLGVQVVDVGRFTSLNQPGLETVGFGINRLIRRMGRGYRTLGVIGFSDTVRISDDGVFGRGCFCRVRNLRC